MRTLVYLLVVSIALAAIVAYARGRQLDALVETQRASDAQVESARQQLDAAQAELAAAKARVDGLGTDKVEVERAIRRKKGLVKPDEQVLLIVPPPEAHTAPE